MTKHSSKWPSSQQTKVRPMRHTTVRPLFMSRYSARKWERGPCTVARATLSVKLGSTISSRNYLKQENFSALISFFYLLLHLIILFLLNPLVRKDRLFFHHGYVAFSFVCSMKITSAPERKGEKLLLFFLREKETKLIN